MDVLKVSTKSNPNSVAGALAGVLREKGGAEIQAIGAGALNQAIKACLASLFYTLFHLIIIYFFKTYHYNNCLKHTYHKLNWVLFIISISHHKINLYCFYNKNYY